MKRKVIIAGIAALCTTVAFSETNEEHTQATYLYESGQYKDQ